MTLPRTRHTGRDRGQDENAFEAFAENEHGNVHHGHAPCGVGTERIGRSLCGETLPDQNSNDRQGGYGDAGEKQPASKFAHLKRT